MAAHNRTWMNPPKVLADTMPTSHRTSKTPTIVQSIATSQTDIRQQPPYLRYIMESRRVMFRGY